MTLLDKSIIKAREDAEGVLWAIDDKITARVQYILETVYKAFNTKLGYWFFYGDSEEQEGSFKSYMFHDEFSVGKSPSLPDDGVFVTKEGGEWGLNDGFPSRWLFEDFEEELKNGIESLAAKRADDKVKAAKKKLEDAEKELALMESIKNKLTAAELKALLKKKNQKALK